MGNHWLDKRDDVIYESIWNYVRSLDDSLQIDFIAPHEIEGMENPMLFVTQDGTLATRIFSIHTSNDGEAMLCYHDKQVKLPRDTEEVLSLIKEIISNPPIQWC